MNMLSSTFESSETPLALAPNDRMLNTSDFEGSESGSGAGAGARDASPFLLFLCLCILIFFPWCFRASIVENAAKMRRQSTRKSRREEVLALFIFQSDLYLQGMFVFVFGNRGMEVVN